MQIHVCVLCRTSGDGCPGGRGVPVVTEGPRGRGADAQTSTVNPLRCTDLLMPLRFQRGHRARLLRATARTEEGAGRAILIPGMCRHLDSLG